MRFTRTLLVTVGVALVLGSTTLLTTSCRMQPAAAAARGDSARERASRDMEQMRSLSQMKPTIDLFVRGLNRGDAMEISAAFLEIGTLEPEKGRSVRGRGAIRSYFADRRSRGNVPLTARIDEAVIGADHANVRATLVPGGRMPAQQPGAEQNARPENMRNAAPIRATFVLRRSAPTDWHIERATLAALAPPALTPR